MSRSGDWGSDVAPSCPVPPTRPRFVQFGGFCFTDGGIAVDIDETDAESFRNPPYAPYTDVNQ